MRADRLRPALAVILALAFAAGGCAASRAFRSGKKQAREGNWDLAVARFTKALDKDPNNLEYRIALEKSRVEAGRVHREQGLKHLAAEELEKAAEEFEIATNYDPASKIAVDDLAQVRERILKRDREKQDRADFEQMKARSQAARAPIPVLSPRSPVPITLKFTDTSLKKVFETLGKLSGVNVLFDPDFRDKKDTVNLSNVTFQEALDQLTFVNRLFYKVIDQNTLIVVPEQPQKRRSYDEQLVRTFYLQNADVNETVTLVRNLTGITKTVGNPSLGAITVVGTPDELAVAEKIIANNDKAKGEVLVELQILEVNRNQLREFGITLSNFDAAVTLNPTGATDETKDGYTNIRAHLLSSINLSDFIVKIPSSLLIKMVESGSNARILASPRLRAAEGKKTALKIGTEVAIPVTTFVSPQASNIGGSFGNATSFQSRNVGVNMELTPKINPNGDITLEMAAEFSQLGPSRNVAAGLSIPDILTRNINGILRVRDGETTLIGGLIAGRDATSFGNSLLGIRSIPVIGGLLAPRKKEQEESEILISITPHIVRAPRVTDEDLRVLYMGTKDTVKVPSARPLFGPPEPAPVAGPSPGPTPSPSPQPQPREQASPPPRTPQPVAPAQGGGVPSTLGTEPQPAPAAPPAPDEPPPTPAPPPSPQPQASPTPAPVRVPSARFVPPGVNLKVDATGTLSLVLMNAQDVLGVDLVMSYDSATVEATDIAPGSLLSVDGLAPAVEKQLELGKIRAKFTRAKGVSGSGAVAALTVQAKAPGLAIIVVDQIVVRTPAGEQTLPTLLPGRVIVTP